MQALFISVVVLHKITDQFTIRAQQQKKNTNALKEVRQTTEDDTVHGNVLIKHWTANIELIKAWAWWYLVVSK